MAWKLLCRGTLEECVDALAESLKKTDRQREAYIREMNQLSSGQVSSATENKYKKAEIRARNKIIMDNQARECGYRTWDEYWRVADKLEQECLATGKEFSFDMVPNKPALPLLDYNGIAAHENSTL